MQNLRALLLDVWREACRHIEIAEAGANIAQLLAEHLPQRQLRLLRIEPTTNQVLTVLAAPEAGSSTTAAVTVAEPDLRRISDWCKGSRLYQSHGKHTGILKLLLSEPVKGDVLIAPLVGEHGTRGVALIVADEGAEFEESHHLILDALREPLAVAMENDTRVHELATLREAAEADRGSLLRRLGKKAMVDEIVGESGGLRPVMERVDLVSGSDVPVLILGETGTGKEVIARAIHSRSPNRHGPFIRVNCGAIPHELIDSQLFGHEKGSFTGAEQTRQGWFERANGGTLFLDEIGELPLDAQVRFLRVLQDGYVERVGGQQLIHVDVRIVAATHRDLASMVRERTFREDLWYRLAVFPILLPPLRDRRDDIPELANHVSERAAVRFGLTATHPSPSDIRLLQQYDWPGNIRELGAVIDRAAILGNGQGLEVAKALGLNQIPGARGHVKFTLDSIASGKPTADQVLSLDEAMKQHIELALEITGGKIEGKSGAAFLLKINPHTLRARMRKLGINWSSFRG
ncbi:MAG: sigma 54-interacting transcriptional regulator [Pirellulales bacterium]